MNEYLFNFRKMFEQEPYILKLKSGINIHLIKHYEQVKNDIDLDIRSKLSNYEAKDESLIYEIIKWNKEMSNKLKKSLELNTFKLNHFFSNHTNNLSFDKENVMSDFINSYCFYLNSSLLKTNFKSQNGIGLMLFTDWYLDKNQIDYLKILFGDKNKQNDVAKIDYDKNILLLKFATHDFINNETLFKNLNNELVLNKSEIKCKLLAKDVTSIEFEDEHLMLLKSETFKTFNHLIKLSLYNFKFASVEKHAFDGLDRLKIFSIDSQPPYMINFQFDFFDNEDKLDAEILRPIQILYNLSELNLHNFIVKESFFKTFHKLTILDLSWCKIDKLKYDFFDGLTSLREIHLKFCQIFDIDDFTFCDLVKLEVLNLRSNKINDLNEKTFSGLANLRKLDLSFNNLVDIKLGTFKMMPQLESLNLSDSLIENLDGYFFEGLTNLELLDLSNTRYLKTSDINTFKKLMNLKSLKVNNCSIENNLKDLFNCLKIQ